MKLIKPIVRVGNSAGVLLPKEWLNGEAEITLLKRPKNINQEVLEILHESLSSIIGLYLVGSYARGEQNEKSDIDVLGITQGLDKKVKKGKYDIILISKDSLDESLKNNALPLLPMLKEAIPIFNKEILDNYINYLLSKKNLRWHIETTLSALKIIKEAIELAREKNVNLSDNIMYSLVLRLREAYIVNCLIKNKTVTNHELLNLIKKLTGSLKAYESYQRSKSGIKAQKKVTINEAESLYNYTLNIIRNQEKWTKRKG